MEITKADREALAEWERIYKNGDLASREDDIFDAFSRAVAAYDELAEQKAAGDVVDRLNTLIRVASSSGAAFARRIYTKEDAQKLEDAKKEFLSTLTPRPMSEEWGAQIIAEAWAGFEAQHDPKKTPYGYLKKATRAFRALTQHATITEK
ncbi:MAG: hypothetical protein P4L85_14210 [Paludisphaera borealis]|uniref:hypothetical protein n=1 Tax=Paludisphaera borealis TaxID=1387353 RepID=UPI0028478052|nr:hypothetical protein [Paludisphaera borealis]MDR3620500.1 hypothetical protein [Paludisphaera borealis]